MNLMKIEKNGVFITSTKKFDKMGTFNSNTIKKTFEFAYEMSFGENGEHRSHRSGGIRIRKKGEIFANTFQGKLSECAVYNQFMNSNVSITKPDFETYGLGEWDDSDFIINNKKISIKSTKSFGNLLLLEKKDWNHKAQYIPNINKEGSNGIYDYTFLVRMKPYCEDILKKLKLLYENSANKDVLNKEICSQVWEYDVPGFITHDDLLYVINNNFIIFQGDLLNGTTKMDATNFYVQAGDMKELNSFIKSL